MKKKKKETLRVKRFCCCYFRRCFLFYVNSGWNEARLTLEAVFYLSNFAFLILTFCCCCVYSIRGRARDCGCSNNNIIILYVLLVCANKIENLTALMGIYVRILIRMAAMRLSRSFGYSAFLFCGATFGIKRAKPCCYRVGDIFACLRWFLSIFCWTIFQY